MQVLAGMADIIVTGKIISVSGDSYTFGLSWIIKGNSKNKITVKMFREWTCDHRWKKAAPGQELLLFLTKNANNSYDIINGSSGEIFIVDDTLHTTNTFWGLKQQPKLPDVITGLKNFVSSYVMIKEQMTTKKGIVYNQLKSDAEILSFKKLNDFSSWLFDGMERYVVEKIPSPPMTLLPLIKDFKKRSIYILT